MKNMFHMTCLLIALLVLGACGERSARTDNPKSYNRAGIKFEYPGNWKVSEDAQQPGLKSIFVESSGSAIVIIQIFPTDDALEIQEYAQLFARSVKEEIQFGTFSASRFGSVEKSDGYEDLTEHFSLILLGEKVPHTRTYRRKPLGSRVCFIVTQVADEDRSKVIQGFEQVLSSFRYEAP